MMNTGIGWYLIPTLRLVLDTDCGTHTVMELDDDVDGVAYDKLTEKADYVREHGYLGMEVYAYIEEAYRRAPIAE